MCHLQKYSILILLLFTTGFSQIITDKDDWPTASTARKRCSIVSQDSIVNVNPSTMVGDTIKSCLNPFDLEDAIIKVPNNTTTIDKDGLALCQLVEGDYVPTIVVYIMDHSGSMAWNDPGPFADTAFVNALNAQASLDPMSYAAYIPFNSNVIDANVVDPIQLNDADSLAKIQAQINSTYGGGTSFVGSFEKAEAYLSESRFDGFNKAVIILADGDDTNDKDATTDLINAGYPYPIYGIFLAADSSDQGKIDAAIAGGLRMEWIAQQTGATSTKITNSDQITPLIETLLKDIVVTSNPVSITLKNNSLGKTRFADYTDFTQQADGSWQLHFNNDIPLKEFSNAMEMTTVYQTGSNKTKSDPINFTIQVTSDIVNKEIEIDETVFATECVVWNALQVYKQDDSKLATLTTRDTLLTIEMTALVSDSLGDTVAIDLYSKGAKHLRTINVYKQSSDDTTVVYRGDVDIYWTDKKSTAVSSNEVKLNPFDTLVARYTNPIDNRDTQNTSINIRITPVLYFGADTLKADSVPVYLEFYDDDTTNTAISLSFLDTTLNPFNLLKESKYLFERQVRLATAFQLQDIPSGQFYLVAKFVDPKTKLTLKDTVLVIEPEYPLTVKPEEIILFDRNIDGKLDSIKIPFEDTINKGIKESYTLTLDWPNERGDSITTFIIDADDIDLFNKGLLAEDIQFLLRDSFAFAVSETGLDSAWSAYTLTQNYKDDFGVFQREFNNLNLIDSMAPILESAEIYWAKDSKAKDSLVVTFSERLDTANIDQEALFSFLIGEEDEYKVQYGEDFEWLDGGRQIVIFFGNNAQTDKDFTPSDSLRALIGEGYLQDKNGLFISNYNEWITIDGAYTIRIATSEAGTFSTTEDYDNKKPTEVEVFSTSDDVVSILDQRGELGMVVGPFKVKENDKRAPEDIRWRYQFHVYSHLGQFVTKKSGVIECTDKIFVTEKSKNCKEGKGIKVALKWNYKDITNRYVGTGVYIFALQVEYQPLKTAKVQVQRQRGSELTVNID